METKEKQTRPAKPRRRKPRGKSYLIFLVFWLVLAGVSFALVVERAGRYNELRAELEFAEIQIDRETERYYDLTSQRDFFDTYAYIEQQARDRLGMMRPNELMFRNIAE